MNKLRKILAVSTIITTFFGMVAVVRPAAAASAGSLIKMDGSRAVYYLGSDNKRYVFPDQTIYMSWYKDFNSVTTVAASEMYSYTIGGNVTMRPGTNLIKITTDPAVYAVEPGGVLRKIASEADAIALYGSTWNTKIVDVEDSMFTNYKMGTPLASGTFPAGQLLSANGTVYYFDGTNYRAFANDSALMANGYKFENVVLTTKAITASGSPITGAETALMTTASSSTTGGVVVGGSSLTVALASNTPVSASIPKSAVQVPFMSFNVTAGADGAVVVRNVTATRGGIGSSTDFSNVYLYDGATRLTTGRTVNSSTNKVTFTGLNLSIAAGSTKTLTLKADMGSSTANNNYFAITAATDIDASGSTVAGTFPVMGNTMVGVNQSVGGVTIARTGSNPLVSPKAGETGAEVAEFNLTMGSTEDGTVSSLTLYQVGNLSNDKLTNFVLKQGGTNVATAASMTGSSVVLNFATPLKMDKGTVKTFQLYADINSTARSADTVIFYLDNSADLYAVGSTYGFGLGVTRDSYDNSVGDYTDSSKSAIEAGQITITQKGPAVSDYSTQQQDVELLRFDMGSQINAEIRSTQITLTAGGTDADEDTTDEGGLVKNAASVNYTDVKLIDVTTGAIIAGPQDLTGLALGDDDAQTLTYTDTWNLEAGKSRTVKVTADVANFTPFSNETVKASLVGFSASAIKNTDTNLFVATTNIVPSGNVIGATHNVKAGALTTTLSATPSAQTYINGTSDIAMVGLNMAAGTGKDVKVTGITLTAVGANSCVTETDCVGSVSLYDGTSLLSTKNISTDTVTFSGLNINITKGTTKTLTAKTNLVKLGSVAGSTTLRLNVASITAQDVEGNNVANTGTPNGPVHSIVANGTINATLAGDDGETESQVLLAGATNVVLAKYRLTAASEDLKITKMRVKFADGVAEEVSSLSLWNGGTRLTNDVSVTDAGTDYVDFNSFIADFTVPKDNSAIITVKANLGTVSNGAASGTTFAATLSFDTNFEARGINNSDTVATALSGGVDVSGVDVSGRTMMFRKSKLTFAELPLSTTAIANGSENEVYKFSATADGGDASIKQLAFTVNQTDNGTDQTLAAASWKLFKGSTEITSLVDIHELAGGTANMAEADTTLIITWTSEELITSGTTVPYTLRATLSGYTVGAEDDSIRVILNNDSTAPAVGFNKLVDIDQTVSQNTASLGDGTVTAGQHLGTSAATAVLGANANIIWSDYAVVAHASTLAATTGDAGGDTVTISTSSADWTNSYLLKTLPFSGKTMNN